MAQLLDQALDRLRELSQTDQDLAAVELIFVNQIDAPQIQLSDEQVAEVERRLAKKNPKTLTMEELDDLKAGTTTDTRKAVAKLERIAALASTLALTIQATRR